MKRFLLGLICMGVGVLFMYYSAQLANMFGKSEWAESYLGSTRMMYILLGFLFILVGFLMWFGLVNFSMG